MLHLPRRAERLREVVLADENALQTRRLEDLGQGLDAAGALDH